MARIAIINEIAGLVLLSNSHRVQVEARVNNIEERESIVYLMYNTVNMQGTLLCNNIIVLCACAILDECDLLCTLNMECVCGVHQVRASP